MTPILVLEVHLPDRTRTVYPLPEGTTRIGRSPQASDLLISIASVARVHAWVHVEGGVAWIEDRQSRNGTYLNGVLLSPLERHRLELDDVIQITPTKIRLGRNDPIDRDLLRRHAGSVGALALQIREDEDWTLLPILADALDDAGCFDPALARTCRRILPRPCGSWVVDRICETIACTTTEANPEGSKGRHPLP